MNQFFYGSRGKEIVKNPLNEGQRNQAFHRSGAPKLILLRNLPKRIMGLLGILGVLGLLVR